MKKNKSHIIYTIGHSTHTLEEFLAMLKAFDIQLVADIRSLPGSRKFPQFNKESLQESLIENNINYIHIPDLGGRRKVKKDSINTRWHKDAFRAYADYMETDNFKNGIAELEKLATNQTTVFMCSEAVWWRCHRSLVADYLKCKGWTVMHIMNDHKIDEHPYTAPAQIINGLLSYTDIKK